MFYENQTVISLDRIFLEYGSRKILDDVSFSVHKGEFVFLIGKTGSGKSTLLRLLYADLKPSSGSTFVAGKDLNKMKRKEIPFLRRKLGIVFQDFQLLIDRNVGENIDFALRASGWKEKVKVKNRISDVLMTVGLTSKINAMPHELSGGEQQRIVIARALINDPVILLADEPTGNLDPETANDIMQVLIKINSGGTAVLMATHNYHLIKLHPARTLVCEKGKIAESQDSFDPD